MPDIETLQETAVVPPSLTDTSVDMPVPEIRTASSSKGYIILFVLLTLISSVVCVPSIISGLGSLNARSARASTVVEDHQAAQRDAIKNMQVLESAVENPQGQ